MDAAHWQSRLDLLAREYGVPGAAFGVVRLGPDGERDRLELASGLLHLGTGVPATPDSLFQIGSITKVWTTTLVMRLVEDGLLDLDAPVAEGLSDFGLADDGAAAAITLRHLLTHSSGFDGDTFTDTGRGDDCLRTFVAELADNRQLFAPGTAWSYNNAAFVVAGRLVEVVTGDTWDEALRERVVEPLGLTRTVTLPEEALLHRVALGHVDDEDGHPVPAPVSMLPRSCGPAGLIWSTAADQLAFATAHLRGGVRPDGTRLLGAEQVAAMAAEQAARVDATGYEDATSWGLGWARGSWDGTPVLGHDGNTIGQSAFLRLLPEHGLATVLLTNGGDPDPLNRALLGELLADLAGIAVPAPVVPAVAPPEPAALMVGTWAQASARLDVRRAGDGLTLRHTDTSPFAGLDGAAVWEAPLVPYAEGVALVLPPRETEWRPVTVETTSTGRDLLHFGWRAHTRV
ncbi:MAG: serine hydrolase domain-containing protein [Nocardioides sp.]